MAKKISNKDFIEEGFGKPLIDFFKTLDEQIDQSKKNLKEFADTLKKDVSSNKIQSGADVKKLEQQKEATATVKRLYKEQEQAQKELAKLAQIEAKKQAKIEQDRRREIQKSIEFEKREKIKLANELIKQRKRQEAADNKAAQRLKRNQEKQLLRQKQLIEKNKVEQGSIKQLRQQLNLLTRSYDSLSKEERENAQVGQVLLRTIKKQREEVFKLEQATGRSQRNVGNYTSALGGLGGTLRSGLGFIGITSAVGLFSGAVRNSIQTINQFEQQLARVKAITGASEVEFKLLKDSAKDLGRLSQFTATQVGKLQEEYAKLGFTTPQILAASEATLQLATATQSDLAQSAEVAASTLNGFGLQARDTQKIVDLMAESFSTTPLDITRFQESMKLVAPTAKSVGESVQDATAKLGLLAKNGITGSIAGTQLNRVFIELNKQGLSLEEAMEQVANSSNKLGTATELVGDRGAKALQIFATQSDELERLSRAFASSEGEAAKMAKTVGDTAEGAALRLSSAWEGLNLQIGEGSSKGFATFQEGIADAINSITDFVSEWQKIEKIGAISFAETFTGLNEENKALLKFINEEEKFLKDNLENRNALMERQEKLQIKIKLLLDEQFSEENRRKRANDELTEQEEKRLERLLRLRRIYANSAQLIAQRIKDLGEEKKATEEENKAGEEANKTAADQLGLLEEITEQEEKLRKEQKESRSPERILAIEKELEALRIKRELLLGINKALEAENKQKEKNAKEEEKRKKKEASELKKRQKEAERALQKELDAKKKAEEEKRKFQDETLRNSFAAAEKFLATQQQLQLEAFDNQIKASVQVQGQLTTLAAAGNKEAAKGLAEEAQNQRRIEAERAAAIKRQTAQAVILAGLELTIAAARRGDADPVATSTDQLATLGSSALEQAGQLSSVAGFFTGTEKVSEDLAANKFYDGKDGYLVRVHGSERVIQGGDNQKLEGLSNEELVKAGVLYKKGAFEAHKYATGGEVINNFVQQDNSELIKEVKELKKAFKKGQASLDFEIEPIKQHLVKTTRKSNEIRRKHYDNGKFL